MSLLVYPRATEKAYTASQNNIYVFNVPVGANKNEIKEAVQSQYGVTVTGIKTVVQSGKAVRYSRGSRRNPGMTNRSDSKKAYVKLAKGESIQVFAEPEAAKEEKK